MIEGCPEILPEVNEKLEDNNLTGILIGGVARTIHQALERGEDPLDQEKRKDLDLVLLDDVVSECTDDDGYIKNEGEMGRLMSRVQSLRELDFFVRFHYSGQMFVPWEQELGMPNSPELDFWYWRNIHNRTIPNWVLRNFDALKLEPGLHIPNAEFVKRLDVAHQLGMFHQGVERLALGQLIYKGYLVETCEAEPDPVKDVRAEVSHKVSGIQIGQTRFEFCDMSEIQIAPIDSTDQRIIADNDKNLMLPSIFNAWGLVK